MITITKIYKICNIEIDLYAKYHPYYAYSIIIKIMQINNTWTIRF